MMGRWDDAETRGETKVGRWGDREKNQLGIAEFGMRISEFEI